MGMTRPEEHIWTVPPPGSGGEKLCQRCGVRQSHALASQECKVQAPAPRVLKDYDPFNT